MLLILVLSPVGPIVIPQKLLDAVTAMQAAVDDLPAATDSGVTSDDVDNLTNVILGQTDQIRAKSHPPETQPAGPVITDKPTDPQVAGTIAGQ